MFATAVILLSIFCLIGEGMSDWIMGTFQKTESKSVPWNLSGIPAAVSFGPRRVTNSSKSTWPSPAEKREAVGVYYRWFFCPQSRQTESEQPLGFVVQENIIHPCLCCLTVHVQSLDDDLQLHLVWHVAQGAHSHPQLLLWDEPIPVAVKHFEGLADLCRERTHTHTHTHTQRSWSLAVEQDMKVGNVPRTKDTFVMPHQCLSHSYMGVGSSGEQIPPVK